jgi:predicted HTH transcriptional regulator
MKNMGGGYLVIGVRDKAWEYIGLKSRLPYDSKALRDKVRKCTGLDLELDIVQHEVFVEGTPKLFGLILVRSATKKSKLILQL